MTQALKPLSGSALMLYPLLRLLMRGERRERLERRRRLARDLAVRSKAQKEEARILAKEATMFSKLLVSTWARLGSMYAARWRYDTGPDTGSRRKRRRTQYVQFERVYTTTERIYFKILVSRRTLFGYKDKLPHRVTLAQLISDETLFELSHSLQRVVTKAINSRNGAWVVVNRLEGIDGLPRIVNYRDVLPYFPDDTERTATVVLGVGEHRQPQFASLKKQPHWLVGGASGGGKSNMVNVIVSSFMRHIHPREIKLVLIDLKRVEFALYTMAPHLYCAPIFDTDSAIEMLGHLVGLIHVRTEQMSNKAKEISEWNKRYPDKHMSRIVVVIDEFAELTVATDKETAREVQRLVSRIAALGRAVGVHLIICTQRPAVEVVPNSVKINMDLIICARTQNKVQSATILGVGDAAELPLLPGRMLMLTGSHLQQIQTPYIDEDAIAEAISVARGRNRGLLELDGFEPKIVAAALVREIWEFHDGSLALETLAREYRELGITRRMMGIFLKGLVKAGRIEADGTLFEVQKKGNSYRLVRVKAPATQEPEPDGPILEGIIERDEPGTALQVVDLEQERLRRAKEIIVNIRRSKEPA